MRPTFLAVLLSFLLSLAAFAATPYQVVDLKGVADTAKGSSPQFFGTVRGIPLFLAATPSGVAIWRTDGTAAGTSILKTTYGNGYFGGFVSNGDSAWFSCAPDGSGWALFKTDGTTTTTLTSNDPAAIVILGLIGNKVFFSNGSLEFWVADGSKLVLLAKLQPVFSDRLSAAIVGNNLYLGTDSGIWKSDGTVNGTSKITSNAGYALTSVNGKLFYGGQTHDNGSELWVTDGGNAGHLVTDFTAGTDSTFGPYSSMEAIGDRVIFIAANGDLIGSDGTESGTSRLQTGPAPGFYTAFWFVEFNGALYFNYNSAFWRSDGTVAGTQMVSAGSISGLTRTASRLYYIGGDSQHTRAIFSSDGTAAGRSFIVDTVGSLFAIAGEKFFYEGSDPYNGGEPWVSDGTAAGTHQIANLTPDTPGSSRPRNFAATADRLYFVADGDSGTAFWSSDGTASGTKEVTHGAGPYVVGVDGSTLYVGRSSQLRKVDATSGETLVRDFSFAAPQEGIDVGGRFYFRTTSQVYATDGTSAGTIKLADANLGSPLPVVSSGGQPFFATDREIAVYSLGSTPAATHAFAHLKQAAQSNLLPVGGALLLIAGDSPNIGLWRFSGGAGDVTLVKSFDKNAFVKTAGTAGIGTARLFFVRESNVAPFQLWRTDGTADGTTLIKQFPATVFSNVTPLVSLGSHAVFALFDGTTSRPWVTDGTAEGTKVLAEVSLTGSSSTFNDLVADGLAYFPAQGGLWQTDGTTEGTKAIPGVAGVTDTGIARLGNTLYFAATTSDQGIELWAYPLPGPGAVTIDDARTNEHDGSVTITVRLTAASNQRVTVNYETVDGSAKAGTHYTAASGLLAFEAGETSKTITIATTNDDAAATPRAFFVKLKDANVAIEKTAASVTIDDDDVTADLELIFYPGSSPRFDVRNNGPAAASNVVLCVDVFGTSPYHRCEAPSEFAAGETRSFGTQGFGTIVAGSVTQWERDPVPGNNKSTWGQGSGRIYASPGTLHPGESGMIADAPDVSGDVTFTSSDPSVIRIDSVSSSTDHAVWWARVTALKIGTATISAKGTFTHTVSVNVAEVVRDPAVLRMETTQLMFGRANEISATVSGVTADGSKPTGTVSFFQDGKPIGTAPVTGQTATIVLRDPLPGAHTYTASYSGDSRFIPVGSDTRQIFVTKGDVSFSAISSDGANVVIVLRGIDGYAPAGALSVSEGDTPRTVGALTQSGPASASATATGFSPSARTVTIIYSGDARYSSGITTIPITGPHRHSAGR